MKKFVWILLAITVLAFFGYRYIYKQHRNIGEEVPKYSLDAKSLIQEFEAEPEASEKKYLNQTIEVNGPITELSNDNLVIQDQLYCQMQSKTETSTLALGEKANVKGRLIGYDDLLGDIKLDQCVLLSE